METETSCPAQLNLNVPCVLVMLTQKQRLTVGNTKHRTRHCETFTHSYMRDITKMLYCLSLYLAIMDEVMYVSIRQVHKSLKSYQILYKTLAPKWYHR